MDGQDMQVPVIMGVLGNNAQTELHTKIGNNDSNFAGTSGFAQGQEDIKGPAKSIPKDEGKGVTKPKTANVANEQAALSGQQETTSQGIPKTNPTREQQRDLESAKAEVESMDPAVKGSIFGTNKSIPKSL